MHRYFIDFSYDGTAYHGWQIQPNGNSVQAELQCGISLLLRTDIALTGAGRTDAGVHARHMVAHFDTDAAFDCQELSRRLNRIVPRDIAVFSIQWLPTFTPASAPSRAHIIIIFICERCLSHATIPGKPATGLTSAR